MVTPLELEEVGDQRLAALQRVRLLLPHRLATVIDLRGGESALSQRAFMAERSASELTPSVMAGGRRGKRELQRVEWLQDSARTG